MRPYAWSDITVTGGAEIPADTHLAVEIRTNGQGQTVLTVRKRRQREVMLQRSDVASVAASSKRTFVVTFEDGSTLELTKPKNCGCRGAP